MGSGLALVSAALFGTNGTARALGPEVNPAVVGAARLMLGALALTIAAVLFEGVSSLRATLVPPKARRWLLTAAFATALYQVTFFGAVARAGVALGTVVAIGSAPIFTGLLSSMTTGDRLTVRWGTATALAVIGCGLMLLPAGPGEVDATGVVLALVAGTTFAAYTVAAKRLLEAGSRPLPILAVSLAAGAILVAPLLVAGDARTLLEPRGVAMMTWLVLAGTVAPSFSTCARSALSPHPVSERSLSPSLSPPPRLGSCSCRRRRACAQESAARWCSRRWRSSRSNVLRGRCRRRRRGRDGRYLRAADRDIRTARQPCTARLITIRRAEPTVHLGRSIN